MSIPNRLSEPRSYLGTAVMFGSVFALPMGLFYSWWQATLQHRAFSECVGPGMLGGVVFGVVFGATIGAFLRGETLAISVSDRQAFLARINIAAAQLGYVPTFATESHVSFRPSWHAGLLAGRLSVQLREHDAVVVGPRLYVKRLALRLEAVA
jgi:hypothetical protein